MSTIESSSSTLMYFLIIASCSLRFRDMTKIRRPYSLVQKSERIIVFLVLSLLFLNLVNKEKEIHIKYELLVSIKIENVHFFQHNYRNIFYDWYDTTDKFCKCIFSITCSFYVECTLTIFKKKILNQLKFKTYNQLIVQFWGKVSITSYQNPGHVLRSWKKTFLLTHAFMIKIVLTNDILVRHVESSACDLDLIINTFSFWLNNNSKWSNALKIVCAKLMFKWNKAQKTNHTV